MISVCRMHLFKSLIGLSCKTRYIAFINSIFINNYPSVSSKRFISTAEESVFSVDNPKVKRYLDHVVKVYESQVKTHNINNLALLINIISERNRIKECLKIVNEMIDNEAKDKDLQALAKEEAEMYNQEIKTLESKLIQVLIPSDPRDDCDNIILEVSAGVGGQEAMLFAKELYDMYISYADYKGWNTEFEDLDSSDIGGIRHGSVVVKGSAVFQHMKHEAGVHRVQRIPQTEKAGRLHTSTASVSVMPQPNEIDIVVKESDLKIETKRASGAGGQHVNKTESAVRMTHIPTGVVVDCQVDRSQIKNRTIALQKLKARLYQLEFEKQMQSSHEIKKFQVGSSLRSEKIRTYNFNQDRITDHRIGVTYHHLPEFFSGNNLLDKLIHDLESDAVRKRFLVFLDNLQVL